MRKIFLLLLLSFTTLLASQIGVVQRLDPHGDGFLSLRVKPKSTEIGKLYNGDPVEILDKSGKYYKVKDIKSGKIGWAHSNWIKKTSNANFLLADIDNDGQKERLQWYPIEINDDYDDVYESYNQLVLFDDNGNLLWKGNYSIATIDSMGGEVTVPVIFDDIDLDGNIEFILWNEPHELSPGFFDIYRWNGRKFTNTTKTSYVSHARDLVWIDAPNGNTLQWTRLDYNKDFSKKKKIWWVHYLSKMPNNESTIAKIVGMQFPDYKHLSDAEAKIRFTPTGAVIEEWIK